MSHPVKLAEWIMSTFGQGSKYLAVGAWPLPTATAAKPAQAFHPTPI